MRHGRIVAVRREAVEAIGSFLPLDWVDGRFLGRKPERIFQLSYCA